MTRIRLIVALALIFGLAPRAAAAQPVTMDRLWPNEDGHQWSYFQHYEVFAPVPQVFDDQVRLVLDGPAYAPAAIVAQYLHHEFVPGPRPQFASISGIADPFLQQVWIARPDLRERIVAHASLSCPEFAPPGPHAILLNGEFAYQKTATEIATWRCDLADTRSWQWLISDLTIGSAFTLQLLPDIANDLFLHGRIAAVESANVPAGSFPNCVRVDYVVDYGTTSCVDGNGDPSGTARAESRGFIRFAPDVGPVESFEEYFPLVDVTGTCGPGENIAASRVTLQLASPSVATRPLTWGAVKLLYR